MSEKIEEEIKDMNDIINLIKSYHDSNLEKEMFDTLSYATKTGKIKYCEEEIKNFYESNAKKFEDKTIVPLILKIFFIELKKSLAMNQS